MAKNARPKRRSKNALPAHVARSVRRPYWAAASGRWARREGLPFPLGVTWIEDEKAYNFALYSKHATSVRLLVYRVDDPYEPAAEWQLDHLTNKSGRVWHCRVPEADLRGAELYGYVVDGPPPEGRHVWHTFDPQKILVDPYARVVHFPSSFDRRAAIEPGCNEGRAPLGVLTAARDTFDWGDDRPVRHESDLVIYELHVRGLTQSPSSPVSAAVRGTYAGVVASIPHLVQLGVTAVELMPTQQFDPQEGNYWGYMTISFFAPHAGYSRGVDLCAPLREFKAMVKSLHEADIEVILDVVYNHTGEAGHNGPTYSFKGIDNSTYYMTTGDPERPYHDYSCTGNTIHSANAHVRQLILDSLRYWVREMHVDGFRFDLASIFARGEDGSLRIEEASLLSDIASEPDLAGIRLIAEPWDAAGAYMLGKSFPSLRWRQWNDRFRDDMRMFVRGDSGMANAAAMRLYGSDDVFPDTSAYAFHPWQGTNYVTAHDGFTLYDVVSYTRKRNAPNGHENKDGADANFSWNCGAEGDDGAAAATIELRKLHAKTFCCLLMLSNGTPMLRMGDEFLHTQRGNNNPYNQDNQTSWLDWQRRQTFADVFRFWCQMIRLRKAHPSLGRSRFWRADVEWQGIDTPAGCISYVLRGSSEEDDDFFVVINCSERPHELQVPAGRGWHRLVDTARPAPKDVDLDHEPEAITSPHVRVQAHTVLVLASPMGG